MCARPKRAPFASSTAARVLTFLSETPGEFVSGQGISQALGVSRVAVWKHVRALRAQGCHVDACRHRGYRLIGVPDLPTEEAVSPRLRTQLVGRPLLFYREVDSTNHQLGLRVPTGIPEGTTLVADHQTAGRGRMGRAWFSPTGVNLHVSILLRPQLGLAQVSTLSLVAGCVLARTVARVAPEVPVRIKWPNDLHVRGRKLGGILCEMSAENDTVWHVVVGIGINVNLRRRQLPRPLAGVATSLAIETGRTCARAELLAELLNQFEPAYTTWCAQGLAPFLPELAACDALRGQTVRIEQANRVFEGVAGGVQADGTLLLRLPDGSHVSVHSGDAHILPGTCPTQSRTGSTAPG